MDHVAIMRKSWGLLPKILAGQKTIESRWYKNRAAPWNKIRPGDTVYFKNSGEKVTPLRPSFRTTQSRQTNSGLRLGQAVRAKVRKVLQFEDLNPNKVWGILDKYGDEDGIEKDELIKYYEMFKDKKYCILIFLDKPEKIKPFDIDKTGYGAMAAWMCLKEPIVV